MNYADTELKYEKRLNVAKAPKNSKSNTTKSDQVSHLGNIGTLTSRSSFLKPDTAMQNTTFWLFYSKGGLDWNESKSDRDMQGAPDEYKSDSKNFKKTLKAKRKTRAAVTEVRLEQRSLTPIFKLKLS